MLDYGTLTSVFKQIAQRHNPSDKTFQLKCFAVIDDEADFNDNSFGRNIDDAIQGRYWTRGGITEDDNSNDFPALVLMLQNSNLINREKRYNVLLGVAMLEDCCKTKEEVDIRSEVILESAINAFENYMVYKHNTTNELTWHYEGDTTIDNINTQKVNLGKTMLVTNNLAFQLRKHISDKGIRLRTTNLIFSGCSMALDDFGPHTEDKYVKTPKCESCF